MKRIIGVIGSKEKKIVSSIINKIFENAGYSCGVMSSKELEKKMIMDKSIEKTEDKDVLIITIDKNSIKTIIKLGIEIDVIVDIDMTLDKYREENYFDDKLKLVKTLKKNKLLIINTDDKESIKLAYKNKEVVVMTYGLNGKNSLTASSLELGDRAKFNLCLQRSIKTLYKNHVEPFEQPMEVNLIGMDNLYSTLAAISVALHFNVDLETIAQTCLNISGIKKNIKKIQEGKFTIIDSLTESPSDYEKVLYDIQNIDYKRLIMMNLIEGSEDEMDKEVADIIKAWSCGVNLKSLVTVVDMSNINKIDHYKKIKKSDVDYSVCCEIEKGIEDCLLKAEQGDMFLILGKKK